MNDPREFYYCIKHQAVEGFEGCRAKHRLGPYPTRTDAENALAAAAERTKSWDEDPVWNDREESERDAEES
uniref:SPOR domain-containing protein n=1 Tax=uncultured bacterium A1Q1_fos_2059 TaxID=1256559 RepID=L7VYH3_9BACT|nr:hypothetical protein [uncultured bacterium A1Q1_fos_2059]